MNFYNKSVKELLKGVSVFHLCVQITGAIIRTGNGEQIEKKQLKTLLRFIIPDLRRPHNSTVITDDDADAIIQELIFQHFLTLSENNPNPETELYIALGEITPTNLSS